jgi:hypothetical protein
MPSRYPTPRRDLELLADCPQEGCSETLMLAHGFTIEQLVELVRAGLATATPQRIRARRQDDGGRDALNHERRAEVGLAACCAAATTNTFFQKPDAASDFGLTSRRHSPAVESGGWR